MTTTRSRQTPDRIKPSHSQLTFLPLFPSGKLLLTSALGTTLGTPLATMLTPSAAGFLAGDTALEGTRMEAALATIREGAVLGADIVAASSIPRPSARIRTRAPVRRLTTDYAGRARALPAGFMLYPVRVVLGVDVSAAAAGAGVAPEHDGSHGRFSAFPAAVEVAFPDVGGGDISAMLMFGTALGVVDLSVAHLALDAFGVAVLAGPAFLLLIFRCLGIALVTG